MERTDAAARIRTAYGQMLLLALLGIPIGIAVGAVCALFGRVLLAITAFREAHPWQLIPFLAVAGIAVAAAYRRFGRGTERGMGLVFAVAHEDGGEDEIPLRLVPLIMVGTWLTHLFGGSAGREGVAVQIGAAIAHRAGRLVPIEHAGRVFVVAGMAAGFAGLFRTPLAACAFALEVLVAGRLEYRALAAALTASLSAAMTSGALGLEKFEVPVDAALALDAPALLRLAAAGLVFGVVGGGFAWLLAWGKRQAGRIVNPLARIGVIGVALSVALLALGAGRYAGLGTNLISLAFGDPGAVACWDWALKLLLTVATLSAGFQGGEVTPLFSIGATLGVALCDVLGLPAELMAALGCATTTPWTPCSPRSSSAARSSASPTCRRSSWSAPSRTSSTSTARSIPASASPARAGAAARGTPHTSDRPSPVAASPPAERHTLSSAGRPPFAIVCRPLVSRTYRHRPLRATRSTPHPPAARHTSQRDKRVHGRHCFS